MLYTPFLLNGAWEMYYREERYMEKVPPLKSDACVEGQKDAAGTEPEDIQQKRERTGQSFKPVR